MIECTEERPWNGLADKGEIIRHSRVQVVPRLDLALPDDLEAAEPEEPVTEPPIVYRCLNCGAVWWRESGAPVVH